MAEQLQQMQAMMTQMLEAQKNYYEKKLAEKSTKRQKTTFEKVPELKKKEDFLTWRDKLLTSLKSAGLEAHILTGVPEPADDDEKRQWRYDRIDVDNLIQSTIADINVWTLLRGQGWKVTDQDPKSTFDHLTQHFDKYTHKATYDIAREFFNIRRGDYDKFTTFQIRLNYLYQRINETDYKMQESAATLNAIQAISDAYPDLYTRSMTNLRNNKLSWADLMLEFNELASQEATQPALSNVKYGKDKTKKVEGDATSSSSNTRSTSMTNKNNERQNSWKSKNQRVDCKECDKDIYTGQAHCGGCGFHYPKALICWWCNPEQAPENWPKRDSALKAKATKTSSSTSTSLTKSSSASSSTTGPLHQQSGLRMKNDGVRWDQDNDTLYHKGTGSLLMELYDYRGVPAVRDALPTSTNRGNQPKPEMASVPYRKMHRRLMHAGKSVVEEACRRAGIELTAKQDHFCEGCTMGKMTDELGKSAPIQGDNPLDFIRVDTVTHEKPGALGYKYSVHIIDIDTNFHWVKYTSTKGQIFDLLKDWVVMVHTQTGRWVKMIGIDGGTEFGQSPIPFVDDKFKRWAREKGIVVLQTPPHTPWMNGKVERAAREVLDKTRATMIAYQIPEHLWTFVMESVVQVKNVLPTNANTGNRCPQEAFAKGVGMPKSTWTPHITHFRAYFCEAYYYVKPKYRVQSDKFAARAEKGRLIGYADLHGKIYWIWNPKTGKIIRASAVKFNEGPDFVPDEDVGTDVEYEAVFTDTTTQEEEEAVVEKQDWVTITHPDQTTTTTISLQGGDSTATENELPAIENEPQQSDETTEMQKEKHVAQLPTPEATPEPTLDAEDRMEIGRDLPVPINHLSPGIGNLVTDEPGTVAPTTLSTRPRRQKAKYGTGTEEGYYAKLSRGELPGQSFYAAHLDIPEPDEPTIGMALSSVKVENDIAQYLQPQIPKNHRQAKRLENYKDYWLKAMLKQDASLRDKEVYELIPKRPGMTILPSKWVFDEKMNPSTGTTDPRARWVVCGNFDKDSWNSEDVFAAVVNSVSVRTFLAVVAVRDLECLQYDFITAFLNTPIPKGIDYYVEPPEGLDIPPDMVCRLRKALYGLRKSPQYWFNTVKPLLEERGFKALETDACLFRHKRYDILLVLYVDDLLIAAPSTAMIHTVRDEIIKQFELKELGPVKRFLGFDIVRDRKQKKIFVSQESYTRALLAKREMSDCHPTPTPWPSKMELPATWEPVMKRQKAYIKDTGSLNWLACGTRPDIAYTVSRLAEANAGPSQAHLDLLKHVFRYLKGTTDLGIEFGGDEISCDDMRMMAFADASLADRLPSRQSTGGHSVFLAGAPVLWKSKKQTFVALSTTEAEFTNLTPTALSTMWVSQILKDCGIPQKIPTVIFTDSNNAYKTVLNPMNRARTRTIDIRYKWIIEKVQKGELSVNHLPGAQMPADGLTKPLSKEKHAAFVGMMGMRAKKIPWAK
ncbi:hypothetical protein CHGG_08792 [Chaetomium globosum CBS 148.51]|uniref:Integrase catalytic domain-containing protein n=1 Tax=Chaetomium globosum (strain ATCC 6205 / CBS 148.51 / DSM 1962 / NBRC 6347 / NRRL 1970) TaxID=306901 RepID=Q2GTB2_CHAGB|nr:uncharacterized protein CHGG_08792 [Chaetomium globosum CBS 148.51]EAQ84778.1 hypothetical protein CHGG_08792 [Chaetomium globosum CBS 148.51]